VVLDWQAPNATVWVSERLGQGDETALLASLWPKLPIVCGLPCLLAALLLFLDEYMRPSERSTQKVVAAGSVCAVPILATVFCALWGGAPGLEPVSVSFLIPSIVFGWILYPCPVVRFEARLAAIDSLGDAVVIIDGSGVIVHANGPAVELLGARDEDLVGQQAIDAVVSIPELHAILEEPSRICGEFFTGMTAASRRCHEVRIHALKGGESDGSRVLAIRDITSSRVAEDRLFYQAHFDSLTGLANRRFFLDKTASALDDAKREGHQVALMYLDLDRFKEINDSLGHAAGDELLRIMAHRLRQHLRATDTLSRDSNFALPEVSRIGGDEFAILMSRFSSVDDVEEVAKRIIRLVSDPITVSGQCVWNGCSIGIALGPNDGEEVGTLVKNADAALYYAKKENRGQYEFFRPELMSSSLRKASLEKQLRGAIEAGELTLHYQPKVDLAEQAVAGAEALLRWENPELGAVPPKEFIPVAEECGLISSIGAWVIATACAQIRSWRDAGLTPLPVSVNVSCHQFMRMDLRQVVVDALDKYDVSPQLLELELTESALLEDNDQTSFCLRELRSMGVMISLDDFGTGYSALSYLNRVPLDILKLDRAFIRDVHSDPAAAGVTSAVIAMAHSLHLRVVAEGVDCAEQLPILKRMGCDLVQGFIFNAALPAEEFAAYLTPHGRKVRIDSAPAALPDIESVGQGLPGITMDAESDGNGGDAPAHERFALIVDNDDLELGRMAMRMNQLGTHALYARDADEGVLFAAQEPGRIHALFVSSKSGIAEVERVAHQIAAVSEGAQPSIVIVGDQIEPDAVASLQRGRSIWCLRTPFDDSELRFVVDAALSPPTSIAFQDRNRVPLQIIAWIRVGDVSGHGVISILSPRGAFIETEDSIPVGTTFQLEFNLSDWPMRLRARVVCVDGQEPSQAIRPPGIGVVFLDRDQESDARIQEEIEKRAVRFVAGRGVIESIAGRSDQRDQSAHQRVPKV
jgi:diguanylate cyclase (GGDEF)-like protein